MIWDKMSCINGWMVKSNLVISLVPYLEITLISRCNFLFQYHATLTLFLLLFFKQVNNGSHFPTIFFPPSFLVPILIFFSLFFFPGIKLNLELLTPSARTIKLLKLGSSFSSQKFMIASQNNWLTILIGCVKNALKTRDQAKSNGSHQRLSISARIDCMIFF